MIKALRLFLLSRINNRGTMAKNPITKSNQRNANKPSNLQSISFLPNKEREREKKASIDKTSFRKQATAANSKIEKLDSREGETIIK